MITREEVYKLTLNLDIALQSIENKIIEQAKLGRTSLMCVIDDKSNEVLGKLEENGFKIIKDLYGPVTIRWDEE